MNLLRRKQKRKAPMIRFSEFSASREKRSRPERKSDRKSFLLPGILWVVFFFVCVYMACFSDEVMIQDVAYVGYETVSLADLKAKVGDVLQGKYLRIISNKNFFFLPKEELIRGIQELSPKIRSVTIRRIFPNKLIIQIEERPAVVIWRSSNGEFLLYDDGTAFIHPHLHSLDSSVPLFVIWDESGRDTQSGDRVTEPTLPGFLWNFSQKFENRFGLRLSQDVHLPSRFSGEFLLHVEDGFDMLVDSRQSVDDILATLQAAMDRGIPESDRAHLFRVDLRTPNKVYYTVRGDASSGGDSSEIAPTINDASLNTQKKKSSRHGR